MGKKTIYIAEDNPVLVNLIQAALGANDSYVPSFFADGLELYQKVQETPPDLLVLDIILPSLSGLAISRLLKFCAPYRHIPIIIITSITDEKIHEHVAAVGADAFLPKPFRLNELLLLIDKFLPPPSQEA